MTVGLPQLSGEGLFVHVAAMFEVLMAR